MWNVEKYFVQFIRYHYSQILYMLKLKFLVEKIVSKPFYLFYDR